MVILGPTGVGKTEIALSVAEQLSTEIVNADSRQIYKELPIGTAAPTVAEQQRVKHWFVGNKSITEDYSAGQYETDALTVIRQLFLTHDTVVLTGGSMMYIDAVCKGLDNLPTVDKEIRQMVNHKYQSDGIEWLQNEVKRLDPAYFCQVDQDNPQRLIHAIEITLQTGVPYSTLRSGKQAKREFNIVQVGLYRERTELYGRINERVNKMIAAGMEDEARAVYHLRGLNSLNTVGYKELFQYFDGQITREQAIELIQQHSRNYAKRQMTWWRTPRPNTQNNCNKSNGILWFDAAQVKTEDIINIINK